MPKHTVLITDYAWPSLDIERRILDAVDAELVVAETGKASELVQLAQGVDAILTCWQQVPEAALTVATTCKIVSRYGIGLDNIPVDHATRMGILVTNVPDFCLDEVSDHVMAAILTFARRINVFSLATRAGRWDTSLGRGMPRLRGQTLGVIGYGNLAQAVIPKALGFGMQVLAYTPRLPANALDPFGIATNTLEVLLNQADYISIHVPLTDETYQMINAQTLRQMKPTAYLINTSRGDVIDEAALYQALTEGWIAGAALDVLSQEPSPSDHPLLALDNTIVTPHVAFYSETAIAELQQRAAKNVAQVLCGEAPKNIVNPQVLKQTNCRFFKP